MKVIEKKIPKFSSKVLLEIYPITRPASPLRLVTCLESNQSNQNTKIIQNAIALNHEHLRKVLFPVGISLYFYFESKMPCIFLVSSLYFFVFSDGVGIELVVRKIPNRYKKYNSSRVDTDDAGTILVKISEAYRWNFAKYHVSS